MNRLIRNQDLPESLWRERDRVLKLPPDLIRTWLTLLERHNLLPLAEQQDASGGCLGGISRDATNKHLAWRFTGSSARVQLAMLDPESHMPHVADAFAQIFAGGRVAVADLPCGSEAAILTILTVLAELRRQGRVPREPLDLIVIGGEISEDARGYAAEGVNEVREDLEAQAISVQPVFLPWDVCNDISNTDLIRQRNQFTFLRCTSKNITRGSRSNIAKCICQGQTRLSLRKECDSRSLTTLNL